MFHNRIHFYGEKLLAPHPTPKLEDRPLLAVRDCVFNIFAATLHTEGRSFVHDLRTCHAMVTGTHLSQFPCPICIKMFKYIKHKTLDNSDVHRSFHEMAPRYLENFEPFTCTMSIHVVLCVLLLNSFSNSPAH